MSRYALQVSELGIVKGFAQYLVGHGFNYVSDPDRATIFESAEAALDALRDRARTHPDIAKRCQSRLLEVVTRTTVMNPVTGLAEL